MKVIEFIEKELCDIKNSNNSYYEIDVDEEYIKNMENVCKYVQGFVIINKYFYSKHIIHDLYCLGATDEEIKLIKEVLENDN